MTALLIAVARFAMPIAHKEVPVALGSNLVPPEMVEFRIAAKQDGRLSPRPSPLVRRAAIKPQNSTVTTTGSIDDDVRKILAQAGRPDARPEQQGTPPGRDSSSDDSRANAGDPVPGRRQKSDRSGNDMDGMERLMNNPDEGDTAVRDKETPLQAAHPESFIVVCEAGCRPSSNKIVYEVSRVAAAAAEIAKRRLETTMAPASDGSDKVATAENAVICVAGCYDDEKPARPQLKPAAKKAESKPIEEKRVPAAKARAKLAAHKAARDVKKIATKKVLIPADMKHEPAKDVRPTELAAATAAPITPLTPQAVHATAPGAIKVATSDTTKAATRASARRLARDAKKARKFARQAPKRTPKSSGETSGNWTTTIARATEETPAPVPYQPGSSSPSAIGASTYRHEGGEPGAWQTSVSAADDDAGTNAASSEATTWGYVIRLAP